MGNWGADVHSRIHRSSHGRAVIDDLPLLLRLGTALDVRPPLGSGRLGPSVRDLLIETLLKVRSKGRGLVALTPNPAQRDYSRRCRVRNIVLKARQVGITTYVAARFFVQTITQPGTLTVQVAHDQESAEDIFKIVHRFWENLPEGLKRGALRTSRANVRQLVFPRLDSEYRVATAADASAGRGESFTKNGSEPRKLATSVIFSPGGMRRNTPLRRRWRWQRHSRPTSNG